MQIYPQHANFLVNLGKCEFDDVRDFISMIQKDVYDQKGIWLEPEVRIIE